MKLDSFNPKALILWLDEQRKTRSVVPASDRNVEPPYIRLWHDVDFSLPWAHRLAELESAAGIKATYSILVGGPFYDVTSAHSIEGLDRIADLGHDFALHFDHRRYLHRWPNLTEVEAITKGVQQDRALLQTLTGQEPAFSCPHRPARFKTPETWRGCTGLPDEHYVSDSAKGFRDKALAILEDPPDRLRLCVHPAWWTVEAPRKETIQARLQQIANLLSLEANEWVDIDSHPAAQQQDARDARSGNPAIRARAQSKIIVPA